MVRRLKFLLYSLIPVTVLLILVEVLLRLIGYDFEDPTRELSRVPVYYRAPTVRVGEAFYRRPGPQAWTGRVISQELERREAFDDLPLYEHESIITVTYDNNGFRNPDGLADWDVVVVGDSFVELGYLTDQKLFTSRMAKQLGIRVCNLGVAQIGPLTYVAYLEAFGKAPSTAHAVMVFYEGNDLMEMTLEQRRLKWVRAGGKAPKILGAERKPQTSLIKALIRAWPRVVDATRRPRSFRNAVYRQHDGGRIPITVYNTPPAAEELKQETRGLLVNTLRRWGETARIHDMTPWLLYMPSKLRVLYDSVDFDPHAPRRFAHWAATDLPLYVESICRKLEIQFINATPYLRSGPLSYNTVFDAHLNESGSRAVADALVDALSPEFEPSRDGP
jgi:hypothetical protein